MGFSLYDVLSKAIKKMKTYLVNLNEKEIRVLVDSKLDEGWSDKEEKDTFIVAKSKLLKVLSNIRPLLLKTTNNLKK